MFTNAATPVTINGEIVMMPANHRYVIVDKNGDVRAFRGRPTLQDQTHGTWGYKAAYMDIPDFGVYLGRFSVGCYSPCLIKFAKAYQKPTPYSTGFIDPRVQV